MITFYYLPIEAGEKIFKHFWYKMTHYVIIEFMQFVEKRSYLKIVNICSNSRVHACLLICGYRLPVYYLIEDATFFLFSSHSQIYMRVECCNEIMYSSFHDKNNNASFIFLNTSINCHNKHFLSRWILHVVISKTIGRYWVSQHKRKRCSSAFHPQVCVGRKDKLGNNYTISVLYVSDHVLEKVVIIKYFLF